MTPTERDLWREAGEINARAHEIASTAVRPGALVLDIIGKIEAFIIETGTQPAFPVNVSIDDQAAHYSSLLGDKMKITENSVVKVDIGVHKDGHISDSAATHTMSSKDVKLKEASRAALDAALSIVKHGVKTREIGKTIAKVIRDAGFQPVKNLSGHSMERYNLHSGVSLPNTGSRMYPNYKLQAGRIYAIEPFATTGTGWVESGRHKSIFRLAKPDRNVSEEYKGLVTYLYDQFRTLPFSPRWVKYDGSSVQVSKQLEHLVRNKIIESYAVLVDCDGGLVSQAEHTVLVTQNGCEVLTRSSE